MPKLTETQKLKYLLKKVIEDETGAYAHKYGDNIMRKVISMVRQKQKKFEGVKND